MEDKEDVKMINIVNMLYDREAEALGIEDEKNHKKSPPDTYDVNNLNNVNISCSIPRSNFAFSAFSRFSRLSVLHFSFLLSPKIVKKRNLRKSEESRKLIEHFVSAHQRQESISEKSEKVPNQRDSVILASSCQRFSLKIYGMKIEERLGGKRAK